MFDVGGGELILIVLVVLLLFGPKKIPEIARMFSHGITKIRQAQRDFSEEINSYKDEAMKPVKTARDQIFNEIEEIKATAIDNKTTKPPSKVNSESSAEQNKTDKDEKGKE